MKRQKKKKMRLQEKGGIYYNVYHLSVREMAVYGLQLLAAGCFLSWMFYQSFLALPAAILFIKPLKRRKEAELKEKRKQRLNVQFKDAMVSVAAALNAGYSIENAWKEAAKEMQMLYGVESEIVMELHLILRQIALNKTSEEALIDLALRSQMEDILCFAQVFVTAKRTGGDLIKIVQNTSNTISQKMEVTREIRTMMTGRKFEQKVMNMVPFGIIGYVNLTAPDFLDAMYGNVFGVIMMTICLFVYAMAYRMSAKIMNVEV